MLVELGNHAMVAPHIDGRPSVTYLNVPDTYSFDPNVNTVDFSNHLAHAVVRNNGVANYDDAEALLAIVHPQGAWQRHSSKDPVWAWSDNPDMARFLSEYYQIPSDRPAMYEELYWRKGSRGFLAPGVPNVVPDLNMLVTDVARVLLANMLGGGALNTTSGTATGTSSTGLTTGTITSVSSNQYQGCILVTPTAWANIVSHTSGTTPTFTLDQWYSFATPGGSAASTPGSTTTWCIVNGSASPAMFMGVTTTNISPAHGDTSLSGEVTTNGMGRKITTWALTSGVSPMSYTSTAVYTYTGSGATTFYAMGLFNSIVKSDTTDTMLYETLFTGSFTVTNNGDQATVTDTITGP